MELIKYTITGGNFPKPAPWDRLYEFFGEFKLQVHHE